MNKTRQHAIQKHRARGKKLEARRKAERDQNTAAARNRPLASPAPTRPRSATP